MSSFFSRGNRRPTSSAAQQSTTLLPLTHHQDDELDAAFIDVEEDEQNRDAREISGAVTLDSDDEGHAGGGAAGDPLGAGSSSPSSSSRTGGVSMGSGGAGGASMGREGSYHTPGAYDFERDPFSSRGGATSRSLNSNDNTTSSSSRHNDPDPHPTSYPSRFRSIMSNLNPFSSASYSRVSTNEDHPHPAGGAGVSGGRNVVMGSGAQNDGVFSNMSAKPTNVARRNADGDLEFEDEMAIKGEQLPSYEAAAADATPPYWETTVIAPMGYLGSSGSPFGAMGPDDVLFDGLPVGNLFAFAWNLLVSMSFQFVGFLLTYLLHTTHAAKNGSRAGLGITLIQYGLYIRSARPPLNGAVYGPDPSIGDDGGVIGGNDDDGPDGGWGWWGGAGSPVGGGGLDQTPTDLATATLTGSADAPLQTGIGLGDGMADNDPLAWRAENAARANEYMGYFLMAVGWFLVLGALLNYWKAVRWAHAIRGGGSAGSAGREESGSSTTTRPTTSSTSTTPTTAASGTSGGGGGSSTFPGAGRTLSPSSTSSGRSRGVPLVIVSG